jgi:hypothetical protein
MLRMIVSAALVLLFSYAVAVSSPHRVTRLRIRSFPSIADLQQQLHLQPGSDLQKPILYGGRIFEPYYVRAERRNGGEYAIIVRLR